MLVYILLWWIGNQLNAPTFYFVILGVLVFLNLCRLLWSVYKKGMEAKSE